MIARGGQEVPGTGYMWPTTPDGQGTFASIGDGGWYLCTNHEKPAADGGGVSVVRFSSSGDIVDASRLLGGTSRNCSSGVTPWGTYLTCEEYDEGLVWEVDPTGTDPSLPVARRAMGSFQHEAACVDPIREHVYLTEDRPDGCLYRFTPDAYPNLSTGLLEVAILAGDNSVTWAEVPFPNQVTPTPTRHQVAGAMVCNGGEGMWYDADIVYFTTKGDRRVWRYNAATSTMEVMYDLAVANPDTPLREVDNITVSKSGDLFVCEDGDNFEVCMITPDRFISAFARLDPAVHGASGSNEVTGVMFDPGGSRMYFAGQRSLTGGVVYEIKGPFRSEATPVNPTPAQTTTTTTTPPPVVTPPPGPGPGPAPDVIAPGVRVLSLAKSRTTRLMLRRGLSILLQIDEPAGIELVLRAPGLGVIARHRTTVAVAGRVRLRLRPTRAGVKRALGRRKRPLRATLVITVRDTAGNATTVRRKVRLTIPRR